MGRTQARDALLAALVLVGVAGAVVGAGAVPHHIDVDALGSRGVELALAAGATVPLAWRRRAPVVVLALSGVAALTGMVLFSSPGPETVGPLLALYTVATCCPRAVSLTAGWVTLCAAIVGVAAERGGDLSWEAFAVPSLLIATAWLIGDNLRVRRAYVTQLEERALRAEAERLAGSERAAATERVRIARELHDVVAHHVSVIAIQAGAARLMTEGSPADQEWSGPIDPGAAPADEPGTLESIEATARQVLTELRRLLGVLRRDGDDEAPPLEPQPGLGSLEGLVETVRKAGLPVELRIEGVAVPLASSIELSAYRIVQEALTNVLKHEGPAPTVVTVRIAGDQLEIEIVDTPTDASQPAPASLASGGHGIVGMTERVALFGGELDVGRREDGSFAVRARIPLGVVSR